MNIMDNAKIIKTIEKYAIHVYLEKIVNTPMKKITLFTIFPHTGAPNLSDAVNYLMVEDLSKLASINSGSYLN
jgi:hypothetical protein